MRHALRIQVTQSGDDRRSSGLATGHNAMLVPVPNWDLPCLAGAGALRSSANDMLTFLETFPDYQESLLAPAMKTMLEVRRPAGEIEIGLGWLLLSADGNEIAWHNGGTGGFRSFIGYDPAVRTGVVVLSNASGVDDIGFHLLNPKLPLANPEPPKQRTEIHIDAGLLDHYNPSGPPTAAPEFELFAEGEKHFFARVTDKQIAFETGDGGGATRLILYQAGREPMTATRLS